MTNGTDGLSAVSQWAVNLMEALGALGAGLAVALENLFPPLPSELILPLAGFTASQGSFTLPQVLAWTTTGSVLGALVLYGLGAWLGADLIRKLVGAVPLMNVSDADKTIEWFNRHGAKSVFFGRMIPVFRSFISIPAGVTRMPLPKFILLTTAGSFIWNAVFVYLGFILGENWSLVEQYAGFFQYLVIGSVVIAVSVFVTRRVRSARSARSAASASITE